MKQSEIAPALNVAIKLVKIVNELDEIAKDDRALLRSVEPNTVPVGYVEKDISKAAQVIREKAEQILGAAKAAL